MAESKDASARTAILVLIAIAVIAAVGYWMLRPVAPPPAPAATASAAPAPAATPGLEPSPAETAGAPEAKPAPGAKPPAAKPKGQPGAGRVPAAAPPKAGAAPPPLTPQAMLRRAFVPAFSAEESLKGIDKNVTGFDLTGASPVEVKRAAEVSARIVFWNTPTRVKPGDDFNVKIGLVNDGKKTIEIKEMQVAVLANDAPTSSKVKPLVKKIAPRQEEVIHEISGTWDKGTRSWTVRVGVLTDKKDLYRNELVWK